MSDHEDKKGLVLGLVTGKRPAIRQKPPKPGSGVEANARSGAEVAPDKTAPQPGRLRAMMIKGESHDPVAGRRFRDETKVTTGIYIRAEVHRKLKILAALERRKFNSYIEEAIDDYLTKIADRLPEIT